MTTTISPILISTSTPFNTCSVSLFPVGNSFQEHTEQRSHDSNNQSLMHEDSQNHRSCGSHGSQDADIARFVNHRHGERAQQVERCHADNHAENDVGHPSFDLHYGVKLAMEIVPCKNPVLSSKLRSDPACKPVGLIDVVGPYFDSLNLIPRSEERPTRIQSDIGVECIIFLVVRFINPRNDKPPNHTSTDLQQGKFRSCGTHNRNRIANHDPKPVGQSQSYDHPGSVSRLKFKAAKNEFVAQTRDSINPRFVHSFDVDHAIHVPRYHESLAGNKLPIPADIRV